MHILTKLSSGYVQETKYRKSDVPPVGEVVEAAYGSFLVDNVTSLVLEDNPHYYINGQLVCIDNERFGALLRDGVNNFISSLETGFGDDFIKPYKSRILSFINAILAKSGNQPLESFTHACGLQHTDTYNTLAPLLHIDADVMDNELVAIDIIKLRTIVLSLNTIAFGEIESEGEDWHDYPCLINMNDDEHTVSLNQTYALGYLERFLPY
ncbi:hypothetical protein L1267_12100 [Pseudoalteromonas sp. OFAV1]|jgi:hypothetical protein|uniref:hypothetical protein n=1 Tax=Pseudoalteromonas sp. OFAV1 TaxID=2908892 RepID=UPI001F44D05B|nr:hypothetical protein [Pseudoalteromonas sp. OFAV1]MCF2901133.1 hypothetical protein [Pseudoalteromonas sp. OFAV1]